MTSLQLLALAFAAIQLPTISALPATNTLPSSLQSCLKNSGADAVYPSDSRYNTLAKPQNTNYQAHPEVIVVPSSAEQVAAIVRCVATEKGSVRLSPRGGGHSYAAYSFSGQVVINPSKMKTISIDEAKKQVTVQFGQTLGPLAKAIGQKGYALPHGTCPSVGVAGHSMGGGWGFGSRKWGWLVDRIVSLQFVDVNGNIKQISASSTGADAELWWALRGAGSNNFGVVTAFTFAMERAPTATVNYELHFGPETDCTQVLLEVQAMGGLPATDPNGLPLDLGVEVLLMGRDSNQDSACYLQGQFLGKKSAYQTVMNKILNKLATRGIKPKTSESKVQEFSSWVEALTDLMGSLDTSDDYLPYYAQSLVDNGAPSYTQQQTTRVFDALRVARGIKKTENDVSFDLLGPGSKTNGQASTGDMAYIHRQGLFLVQIYSAYFPGPNDSTHADAVAKITAITDAIKQAKPASEWHSYQNYIDPYLQNFGHEYYGDALGRLKSLKTVADPHVIFDFPQGLGHA